MRVTIFDKNRGFYVAWRCRLGGKSAERKRFEPFWGNICNVLKWLFLSFLDSLRVRIMS